MRFVKLKAGVYVVLFGLPMILGAECNGPQTKPTNPPPVVKVVTEKTNSETLLVKIEFTNPKGTNASYEYRSLEELEAYRNSMKQHLKDLDQFMETFVPPKQPQK